MNRLNVWITFQDGSRTQCGQMVFSDPDDRGRRRGAFRYDAGYPDHPMTFSLDPVELPLLSRDFETDRHSGIFLVFEDSLPDVWGRRLLARKARLPRSMQNLPGLLKALAGDGLGALSFFHEEFGFEQDHSVSVIELENLLDEARRFEKGLNINDDQIRLLLKAGSSPGGGRPKALVQDEAGVQWIAKFPSLQDRLDIVPIEAATMSLAAKAGMETPKTRVMDVSGRKVLLVKRFDVTAEGGRCHMISFQTLLRIDPAEGYYHLGYRDLYGIIRKYGSRPETDVTALYRQMVFNGLIGNTDDHLKNFIMLGGGGGYVLSPAFDLLPDTENRHEHVLHFDYDYYFPGKSHLAEFGKRLGVPKAALVVNEVAAVVATWPDVFKAFAVPVSDIEKLSAGISRRLRKV
ncbi:MAG: HipA domain-containing protein [Deltaproteobacteria bacterium]|nr:HipA domain-containing protein [Deltaproteobacteria bacterium]